MNEKNGIVLKALIKSTYLGLVFNTLFPAVILIIAYLRSNQSLTAGGGFDLHLTESISPMFYAFLVLSFIEMVLIYFIRTKLPARIYASLEINDDDRFVTTVFKTSLYMFLLTALISLYGLIMMYMGGSFEVTVLFVALTFMSYQIFRPRKDYLEKMYDRLLNQSVEKTD